MQHIRIKHAVHGPWWSREVTDATNTWVAHEDAPPPGVLHGDTWNPNTGVIERGDHGTIVGIVDFVAKVRYGFSSRGVPQYLFHPADPRWPPMIVGSKAAPVANQWGLVSTKDLVWSTTKSRWPQVSLQRLLGPVGDAVAEAEALRQRYLRPCGVRSKSAYDGASCLLLPLPLSLALDESWDEVFNIDPAGCRDVDDIIAFRKTGEGSYMLGIGIALVAALVAPGSPEDVAAYRRAQTLYRDGVAIEPMLPTSISESSGSLLADGLPRGVLMATWELVCSEEDGAFRIVGGPVWLACRIINRRTFTYESVLEDTGISNILPQLLAPLCGASTSSIGTDPHRWIEVAMIAYNCAAAERLAAAGVGILRRHRGALQADALRDLAAQTGCAEIAFLGYAAGEYVAASSASDADEHVGLGVACYCHATSPLRRYADLVCQRALLGLLSNDSTCGSSTVVPTNEDTVTWLNERAKEARAIEREGWYLAQLSATELRSADGWVVGQARVYVSTWKRVVKIPNHICEKETFLTGEPVRVTAFWDTRSTPEHRFVFRFEKSSNC